MLERFLNYIEKNNLKAVDNPVLLTISGGIDSIVLAHLYHKAKLPFGVAHCNFTLRSIESDDDETFAKQLADSYDVPFHSKSFPTQSYADEKKISTQMAARELRYEWFENLSDEFNYEFIVTAHHLNDSLETALFNFTKGTGIAGLRGIKNKSGKVIRPLLFASREEIETYAKENDLKWREDSSNSSSKYHRNMIRNKVIPLLKEINPNLEQTSLQTFEKLSLLEGLLKENVEQFKRVVFDNNMISIEALSSYSKAQILLYEFLQEYNFSYSDCADIINSIGNTSGKKFLSSTHRLIKDRDYFILHELEERNLTNESVEINSSINLPDYTLIINVVGTEEVHIPSPSIIAYLDYDLIKEPIYIRTWKEGDHFTPLGMSNEKKLSDFFIDEKIPLHEKEKQLLLCSGKEILWIIGKRINDKYKITDESRNVLKVETN